MAADIIKNQLDAASPRGNNNAVAGGAPAARMTMMAEHVQRL
jgi:hypothetical protein